MEATVDSCSMGRTNCRQHLLADAFCQHSEGFTPVRIADMPRVHRTLHEEHRGRDKGQGDAYVETSPCKPLSQTPGRSTSGRVHVRVDPLELGEGQQPCGSRFRPLRKNTAVRECRDEHRAATPAAGHDPVPQQICQQDRRYTTRAAAADHDLGGTVQAVLGQQRIHHGQCIVPAPKVQGSAVDFPCIVRGCEKGGAVAIPYKHAIPVVHHRVLLRVT
mmetsp:Transcript_95037/g.307568  ORF Transcript_95037/g.307568 Transcript_95037/m.307568 type:complete len:218 (+) Transcript_95037:347-1000(+)